MGGVGYTGTGIGAYNSGIGGIGTGYGTGYGTGMNSYGYNSGPGTYGSTYGSTYGGYGSGYGGYGSYNRFGTGYGGYGSTYNRFGSGYGGYGGGYGGYGTGAFGQRPGMYGAGPMGPMGNPNNPNEIPLTAQIEQSTSSAFQVMDQVVQSFGGFAQMLESTFFATHSSFMAMVGVAEQLGYIRNYVGQLFAAFTIFSTLKRWIYRAIGRLPPGDANTITPENFEKFNAETAAAADPKTKQSRRPIWIFLLFMVGIPWLMSKLIQRIQRKRLEEAAAAAEAAANNPLGAAVPGGVAGQPAVPNAVIGPDGRPLDPSQIKNLEFCRALYDFKGESPAELTFQKDDIIAILSRTDPVTGQPSSWWRGRLRSGPIGYFPSNYVEILEKRQGAGSAVAGSSNSTGPGVMGSASSIASPFDNFSIS
ncbi:Peroxin 13, N-terminal region-domain-containing protein [Zopfochytrium polystomum]|nr:Peroxin 13, N-terminal region-domain-containing protein [Zopfochytrium polystomum]